LGFSPKIPRKIARKNFAGEFFKPYLMGCPKIWGKRGKKGPKPTSF